MRQLASLHSVLRSHWRLCGITYKSHPLAYYTSRLEHLFTVNGRSADINRGFLLVNRIEDHRPMLYIHIEMESLRLVTFSNTNHKYLLPNFPQSPWNISHCYKVHFPALAIKEMNAFSPTQLKYDAKFHRAYLWTSQKNNDLNQTNPSVLMPEGFLHWSRLEHASNISRLNCSAFSRIRFFHRTADLIVVNEQFTCMSSQ